MRPWFRSWVNHMMSWFRYEGVFKVPKADAKERDKFIFQIPQKDEKVSFGYTISQKKISREYDDEDKAARAFDIELVAIGLKAVNFPNYSDVYNLEQYLSGLTKEEREEWDKNHKDGLKTIKEKREEWVKEARRRRRARRARRRGMSGFDGQSSL